MTARTHTRGTIGGCVINHVYVLPLLLGEDDFVCVSSERTAVLQGLAKSSTKAKRFLCEACPRLAAAASRSSEGVMYDATIRAINPSG